LNHAFTPDVEYRSFDMEEVASTPYNYSDMQPLLFVVPSFAFLCREVEVLLKSPLYRG
jgi:phenylalanine-4-hydroxylase